MVIHSNRGYTLYLTIVIITISSILFSITLYNVRSVKVLAGRKLQMQQAALLCESGLEIAEYFLNGGDGHSLDWETDLFTQQLSGFGTITVSHKRFGLFSKTVAQGERLKAKQTVKVLVGRTAPSLLQPLLTLTEKRAGLVIDNNSSVGGTVNLDGGTVRYGSARSTVAKSFQSDGTDFPPLPFSATEIDTLFNRVAALLTGNSATLFGNHSLNNVSVTDTTLVVRGVLTIGYGFAASNSILVADSLVITGGETRQSLLYSKKKLVIESGFHDSQLFSDDTIWVSKNSRFKESTLLVSRHYFDSLGQARRGGLVFENGTQFTGTAISYCNPAYETGRFASLFYPTVMVGTNSIIDGSIVTDGDISMKNVAIRGNLWCRSIITMHEEMPHKNFLIECSIKPLAKPVLFPLIGGMPVVLKMKDLF